MWSCCQVPPGILQGALANKGPWSSALLAAQQTCFWVSQRSEVVYDLRKGWGHSRLSHRNIGERVGLVCTEVRVCGLFEAMAGGPAGHGPRGHRRTTSRHQRGKLGKSSEILENQNKRRELALPMSHPFPFPPRCRSLSLALLIQVPLSGLFRFCCLFRACAF